MKNYILMWYNSYSKYYIMTIDRLIRPTCRGLWRQGDLIGNRAPIRSLTLLPNKPSFRKKYYLALDLNIEYHFKGRSYISRKVDNLISSLNIKEIKREWVEDGEYYGVIIKIKRVT